MMFALIKIDVTTKMEIKTMISQSWFWNIETNEPTLKN